MSMDLTAATEAGARDLDAKHWDGTGCGSTGSGACSSCYGPSPMSATEVAESVLQSALEYIDTDDKAIAEELRKIAEGAEDFAGQMIPTVFLLRRANELDPPTLPTEPGWYPNVSVRGGGYRPGAFRSSAAVYRWSVVNTEGLSVQLTDDRIEVAQP